MRLEPVEIDDEDCETVLMPFRLRNGLVQAIGE